MQLTTALQIHHAFTKDPRQYLRIPIVPVLTLIITNNNTNETCHKTLYISVISPAHYYVRWFVPWKQFFPRSLRH